MTEPMSQRTRTKPGNRRTTTETPPGSAREQEIRALPQLIRRHAWTAAEDAADAICDLIAEVDSLRDERDQLARIAEQRGARVIKLSAQLAERKQPAEARPQTRTADG